MKPTSRFFVLVFLSLAAVSRAQEAEERAFEARLDDVIDWQAPLELSEEKIAATWKQDGYDRSPLYAALDAGEDSATPAARVLRIGERPYRNVRVRLSALAEGLLVREGHLLLAGAGEGNEIELRFAAPEGVAEALAQRWQGRPSQSFTLATDGGDARFTTWTLDGAAAALMSHPAAGPILRLTRPGRSSALGVLALEERLILCADLDFLLAGTGVWALTPEDLERRFAVHGLKDQIFFQWLDTARSRARFTRKPFSNVSNALSLFGGQVQAQEANLDFEDGRLARITLSIYNRGDSGELTVPEFEKRIQTTGRQLGQRLGVAPKPQTAAPAAAVKTTGWQWTAPAAVALMEHNDIQARAAKGASRQPEFLRLKLAPPGNRDWSMGATAVGSSVTTVTRGSLLKNVRKSEDGAVFINGVPMVDQGDKGYCVVASCQRLFEYYQIACDQHELAQLVGTTAERGTNSRLMEAGLNKIDSKFKTRFKALISPGMDARDRQRLDQDRFFKMVRDSVNEGIPLLWTLQLGLAPEDPPLSASGQVTGGHMRLIIGYDEKAGDILFTDSWGAGHEKKRMTVTGAFASTDGLYVLTPRAY